jgi:hypothetical protein
VGGLLTATGNDDQGSAAGDAFGLGPGEDRDVLIYQGHRKILGRTGRIAGGALAGVTAVPVMLGGHRRHALAAHLLLKPVLVELGATCPTRGLFLLESEYAGGETLDGWLELARLQVAASVKTLQ